MKTSCWQFSLLTTTWLISSACADPSAASAADGGLTETGGSDGGSDGNGNEAGGSASETHDGDAGEAGGDGDGDAGGGGGGGGGGDGDGDGDASGGDGDAGGGDGDGDAGDGDGNGDGDGAGSPGDGDPGDGDGDSAAPVCGNGMLEVDEACDLGESNSDTGWCKSDCTPQICGDGFTGPDESCDDGNGDNNDECSNQCGNNVHWQCNDDQVYFVLDLADRNVDFNDGDGNVEWCDRTNNAKVGPQWQGLNWYRLMGDAGTRIPEDPPLSHSCGAEAPGWMLGEHPEVIDGVVARTTCFSWANDTCQWQAPIEVVNCGDHYLYRLPNTTTCALRYCGTD